MAFEIHIFEGDSTRGPSHKGFMFSIRAEDGSYHKSNRAYGTPGDAVRTAAVFADVLNRESPACQT